jgi:hypothetical protein
VHGFLAIPVLCTLGLQACQHQGASSFSCQHQPAQETLTLCNSCLALCKPIVPLSVYSKC